jgi:hypothetical protein
MDASYLKMISICWQPFSLGVEGQECGVIAIVPCFKCLFLFCLTYIYSYIVIFLGIWQLFVLANILKCPIMSVYPQFVQGNLRLYLHRIMLSEKDERIKDSNMAHIMWTSTFSLTLHLISVPLLRYSLSR